jgi:hypothetical protein
MPLPSSDERTNYVQRVTSYREERSAQLVKPYRVVYEAGEFIAVETLSRRYQPYASEVDFTLHSSKFHFNIKRVSIPSTRSVRSRFPKKNFCMLFSYDRIHYMP